MSGGVGGTKRERRNQTAQPNQTRNAPNPNLYMQKTPQTTKAENPDLKTKRKSETTQGENARHQDAEKSVNNHKRKTQKYEKLSIAAAACRSTTHGRASRLVYVTLDPPRERASFVDLKARKPRTAPVEVV